MSAGESIRVILRVRPFNSKEIARGCKGCVKFLDNKTVSVDNRTFNFDRVLPMPTTQLEAYDCICQDNVSSVLEGYNSTIFAYGQTSSGKTYTMEGKSQDPEYAGVIPRIVDNIFNKISSMSLNYQFVIKVSYMEVYMERIKDCLNPKKENLPIGETKNKVPYVKGITEKFVSLPEEVIEILNYGRTNRTVAATNMNEVSSRSHAVFTMTIKAEDLSNSRKKEGTIFLVDLAGSEKISKTGAEGVTLDEAKMINKSLSTLGQVINALVEGHSHVPYRDSKLTRILQNSLGGNSKTTLVVCCSPDESNLEETKSTLFFGTRAKNIKNTVVVNEELSAEGWKLRHDNLFNKHKKLLDAFEQLTVEVKKWRTGKPVKNSEWVNISDGVSSLSPEKVEKTPLQIRTSMAESVSSKNVDVDSLYKEIDSKDEEINLKSQEVVEYKDQVTHLSMELKAFQEKFDIMKKNYLKMNSDLEISKGEVKEILTALEELAQNYDYKSLEVNEKSAELESMAELVTKLQEDIKKKETAIGIERESKEQEKVKTIKAMRGLIEDLEEAACSISPYIEKAPAPAGDNSWEAEVVAFRLFITRIRHESFNIQKRIEQAERQRDAQETEYNIMRENYEAMEVQHNEMAGKLDSLRQTHRETYNAKKDADERVAKLASVLKVVEEHFKKCSDKSVSSLQERMKECAKAFSSDVANIQEEKGILSEKVVDLSTELAAAKEKIDVQAKYRKELEQKVTELSSTVVRLENQAERREDAKRQLKSVEESVIRELQTLHKLRNLFVEDLKLRIAHASNKMSHRESRPVSFISKDKSPVSTVVEEQSGNLIQNERITVLKNTLDSLTRVHKQLVRENSDLRCELPKLEKRLKATQERVKNLENTLKECRDIAIRDRRRYQIEVELIKKQFRNRNPLSNGVLNIIKPIQSGIKLKSDEQTK